MLEGDAFDLEASRQEFEYAVEYVGTGKGTVLCESLQRRLFGMHAEQLAAWQEAGGLSELAAMQEYVNVVSKHDASFLMGESGGNSDTEMEQPACKDTGATCFRKNKHWSSCNATCAPNMKWVDGAWVAQPEQTVRPALGGGPDGRTAANGPCSHGSSGFRARRAAGRARGRRSKESPRGPGTSPRLSAARGQRADRKSVV